MHTPEDAGEVAAAPATRCPVNPLDAGGATTHAEHPAHPLSTAAAVATLRRGAMVNSYRGARGCLSTTLLRELRVGSRDTEMRLPLSRVIWD